MRILLLILIVLSLQCEGQLISTTTASKRSGGAGSAPINVTPPSISGTTNFGDVLTCSNGAWSVTPDSYTYSWKRNSVSIGGATNASYSVNYLDDNATITCVITATKSGIVSSPITSSNSKTGYSMAGTTAMEGWWDVNNAGNTVSGAAMQSLLDKSPNARHMTATDGGGYPTYTATGGSNNLGYITIGSKSLYINSISSVAQPFTVYFIYKNNTITDGKKIYQFATSNGWVSTNTITAGTAIQYHAGSTYNIGITNGTNTNWQMMTNHIENDHSYLQIKNEPYRKDGYTNQGQSGTTALSLFGFQPTGSMADIRFSEAIIISGTVSSTTDANIRLYLTQKYAITENPWAVFFGDSITTGALATDINSQSYLTVLSQNKGYDYISIAYPGSVAVPTASHPGAAGENLADTYTRAFVVSDTYLANGYFFFAYGTNDQSPDASWKASYKAIIQSFITKGVPLSHIIMIGVPYRSSTTPLATPYIIAIASELGVSYYDNQAHMAANGGATLMNVDGIHPNTAGHADMASGLAIYLP